MPPPLKLTDNDIVMEFVQKSSAESSDSNNEAPPVPVYNNGYVFIIILRIEFTSFRTKIFIYSFSIL